MFFAIKLAASNALIKGARALFRPKYTVPSIAQAGQNVSVLVELTVNGSGVNRHIGVRLLQVVYSLGAGQQADEFDGLGLQLFQPVNRRNG